MDDDITAKQKKTRECKRLWCVLWHIGDVKVVVSRSNICVSFALG